MTWTEAQAEHYYRRYVGLVRYRAMRILADEQDAREITQEAFARLLHHYRPADAEETPAALLTRITTNLALNLIRNRTARRQKLAQHGPELGVGRASLLDYETIERAELVRSLLDRVPRDVAHLAINYYIDGMTQEEIAELHRISVPTVRKRLALFVRRSRKALQRDVQRLVTLICSAVLR